MLQSLMRRFRESDNARDSQRSGRPRVPSGQQHNHRRLMHLQDRFQTSSLTASSIHGLRSISFRTIRNIFRDRHIRPRRSAIHPMLLSRHCVFEIQKKDWANILLTDESRFHLDSIDGRFRVYRRVGERYAETSVIQRPSFCGSSVMVWEGITERYRISLEAVAGNITRLNYRDTIVQRCVILYIHVQANNVTS